MFEKFIKKKSLKTNLELSLSGNKYSANVANASFTGFVN